MSVVGHLQTATECLVPTAFGSVRSYRQYFLKVPNSITYDDSR